VVVACAAPKAINIWSFCEIKKSIKLKIKKKIMQAQTNNCTKKIKSTKNKI
jgi:hypothetical protein